MTNQNDVFLQKIAPTVLALYEYDSQDITNTIDLSCPSVAKISQENWCTPEVGDFVNQIYNYCDRNNIFECSAEFDNPAKTGGILLRPGIFFKVYNNHYDTHIQAIQELAKKPVHVPPLPDIGDLTIMYSGYFPDRDAQTIRINLTGTAAQLKAFAAMHGADVSIFDAIDVASVTTFAVVVCDLTDNGFENLVLEMFTGGKMIPYYANNVWVQETIAKHNADIEGTLKDGQTFTTEICHFKTYLEPNNTRLKLYFLTRFPR
jgi:hypothetical protein